MHESDTYDVIVAGAGVSGLASAKLLQDQGLRVLVLEANDRVGGRTLSIKNSECGYTDLGGAYVGPTQNRLLRLARIYGAKTYIVDVKQAMVYNWRGKSRKFYTSYPPMPGFLDSLDMNNLFRTIDEMCDELPLDAPWKAPRAQEWDTTTVKEFFDKMCWTRSTREFADKFVNVNVTVEPYEASLLWFIWYIKRCGGTMRIFSCTNGGQERKFVGGAQQISEGLARDLGEAVLLNHPVSQVTYTSSEVKVNTMNGREFKGRYLVMAMAPPLQLRITYDPPMPVSRNQLVQRMPMGSVIKTMTYYDRAYWKEQGMCGMAAIIDDEEIVGFCLDDCKPDGTYPCLMGFILADKAHRFAEMSRGERSREIAKCYAKIFGIKEMERPRHYEEKDWQKEPWSGGCYTCMMPPGFLTKFGKELRKPIGPIYFAGTETAQRWSGYIEGGIEAGERAAREILCNMGKLRPSDIWVEEPEDKEVIAYPFPTTFWERNAPSVPGFLRILTACGVATGLGVGAYLWMKHKPDLKLFN